MADRITACQFSLDAGEFLDMQMTATQKHSGAPQPEVMKLHSTIRFSN